MPSNLTNRVMTPQGTKFLLRKLGKIYKELGCDIMGNISDNGLIFGAIMKNSFIAKMPEGIEDCLNQTAGYHIVLIVSIEP